MLGKVARGSRDREMRNDKIGTRKMKNGSRFDDKNNKPQKIVKKLKKKLEKIRQKHWKKLKQN